MLNLAFLLSRKPFQKSWPSIFYKCSIVARQHDVEHDCDLVAGGLSGRESELNLCFKKNKPKFNKVFKHKIIISILHYLLNDPRRPQKNLFKNRII